MLLSAFLLVFFPLKTLYVYCEDGSGYEQYIKVDVDEIIEYDYIFQNGNIPVKETFKILEDNRLSLIKVELFCEKGTKLPYFDLGDEEFKYIDGRYVIEGVEKKFSFLQILIEKDGKNYLNIDGEIIDLFCLVNTNGLIIIKNKKIPISKYYLHKYYLLRAHCE